MHEFQREALSLLSLASIKGVGFETLRGIARSDRTFSSVVELDDADEVLRVLSRHGAHVVNNDRSDWRVTKERLRARAEKMFDQLSRAEVKLVFRGDPDYPPQLMDLRDPPFWLFVQGDVSVLSRPALSVVGTREPSEDGLWLVKYVGHCLHEWGVPTVSGLAVGIDQEIHNSSLRAKLPTVAFLGTGIFSDYPRNSAGLRREIVRAGGAIVTEYLPGEGYSAKNFVRRNRLQAALGRILIPVEWASKSGTAHTVKYAANLGRPLAFIRTPDQESFDWIPSDFSANSDCFTLPLEHERFVDFISAAIEVSGKARDAQLSFFDRQ